MAKINNFKNILVKCFEITRQIMEIIKVFIINKKYFIIEKLIYLVLVEINKIIKLTIAAVDVANVIPICVYLLYSK